MPENPAGPRNYKPAKVRFYFDADVLGLAHVIARLRPDTTYPGDPGAVVKKRQRPPCPIISPAVLDHIWIPQVAALSWLIITRDSHIQDHRAEIAAVRDNGARMIVLAGRDARSTFEQLEVLMTQWRHIHQRLNEDGPFIYSVTRTSFRSIGLCQ